MFKYNFFLSPSACFKNWSEAKLSPAPENVNLLYVAVLGFYIQALVYCILIGNKETSRDNTRADQADFRGS